MSYIICMAIIAILLLILLFNSKSNDREELKELKRENEEIKRHEAETETKRQEAQQAKQDARTGDHAHDLNTIAQRLHMHATGSGNNSADN